MPPKQNRKHPRIRRQIPVRYKSSCGEPGERSGFTDNLSAGGLFIYSLKPVPEGTLVKVKVDAPPIGPVELTGEAVFVEGVEDRGGFGIRFVDAPSSWVNRWE